MKNHSPQSAGSGAPALSLADQVKMKIISAGGLVGAMPADLADADDLSVDYQFDAHKYALLCLGFQQVVNANAVGKQLSCTDVSDCSTVKDCVKLVSDTVTS